MSLITTDEVVAVMAPGIDTDALQDVIDREESWLARRIGQLTGERTITLYPPSGRSGPLFVERLAGTVVVTDAGLAVDTDLRVAGREVGRIYGSWIGPVTVKFTPDDEADVKRVLLELIRMTLSSSPYRSESSEGHSYQRDPHVEPMREALARRLIRPTRGTATISLG